MAEQFTSITGLNGVPDAEACFEQASGVTAVYSGRQSVAADLLALCGGGVIDVWIFDPKGILPSLALLHQGGHYYLWVAGTVNVRQWAGNVIGAVMFQDLGDGVYIHTFFYNLAKSLWAVAQPYMPAPASALQFTLVGHSLGGAVAQIFGYLVGQRYSARQVEVLTFGQPKSYGDRASSYNAFGNYWRIRIDGDPVPMTPLDQAETFWAGVLSGSFAGSSKFTWSHYGSGYLLGADGAIVQDQSIRGWQLIPGQWALSMQPQRHLMRWVIQYLENGLGV